MAKKKKTTTGAKKRSSAKRDLVSGRSKSFAKRRADGTFKEMDDVGRSLSADRRSKAKRKTKSGYGDQGDRRRSAKKSSTRKTSTKKK